MCSGNLSAICLSSALLTLIAIKARSASWYATLFLSAYESNPNSCDFPHTKRPAAMISRTASGSGRLITAKTLTCLFGLVLNSEGISTRRCGTFHLHKGDLYSLQRQLRLFKGHTHWVDAAFLNHGASENGLKPLQAARGNPWVWVVELNGMLLLSRV